MNPKLSLAALSLALFAASAFATNKPATDPTASTTPAATTDTSAAPATPAPKAKSSSSHHAKLHCKAGEAAVKASARRSRSKPQELQLSIEQPGRSRAQSGRFWAYDSRPGCSS